LPELTLKKFDGNVLSYQSWIAAFQHQIGSRTDISNINKWGYLYEMVTGEAATALDNLDRDTDNYEAGLDRLKERFGNVRVINSMHMKALIARRPINANASSKDIRALHDFVENTLNVLRKNGAEMTASHAVALIEEKLNPEIAKAWDLMVQGKTDAEVTPELLLKCIMAHVRAEERKEQRKLAMEIDKTPFSKPKTPTGAALTAQSDSANVAGVSGSQQERGRGRGRGGRGRGGGASAQSNDQVQGQGRGRGRGGRGGGQAGRGSNTQAKGASQGCPCCNGTHELQNCPTFKAMDIQARWTKCLEKRVCFCCFKDTHTTRRCPDKAECPKPGCTYPHHVLLHKEE
jgi:hypothetical protein